MKFSLDELILREAHVVPQVVEPEDVVGAIGDIRIIGFLLLDPPQVPIYRLVLVFVLRVEYVRSLDFARLRTSSLKRAHAYPKDIVNRPHPLGVELRQVIVHGYQVCPFALQCIEIKRRRCDQRLTFTGLHLRDAALVQDNRPDQLDVKLSKADCSFACLSDCSECLR